MLDGLTWINWMLLCLQCVVVVIGLAIFKQMGYEEGFADATQARTYLMRMDDVVERMKEVKDADKD